MQNMWQNRFARGRKFRNSGSLMMTVICFTEAMTVIGVDSALAVQENVIIAKSQMKKNILQWILG
jgi:hypothetical protein